MCCDLRGRPGAYSGCPSSILTLMAMHHHTLPFTTPIYRVCRRYPGSPRAINAGPKHPVLAHSVVTCFVVAAILDAYLLKSLDGGSAAALLCTAVLLCVVVCCCVRDCSQCLSTDWLQFTSLSRNTCSLSRNCQNPHKLFLV